MNQENFFEKFELFADAPNAVGKMREIILTLAVQGKLVPQDPSDESARILFEQIQKTKNQSISERIIRPQETNSVEKKEAPFTIPKSWLWTRLGEIGEWGSGSTPPRGNHDLYGGTITWLKSGELNDNQALKGSDETVTELALNKCSFRRNKPGDVLLAMYGATIGKVAILAEHAVTNQAVCACTPFNGVENRYLFVFLLSQRTRFHSISEGGAQPNISKVKIISFPFPLPPLAEQKRIIAKVDELMAICDRLEAQLEERETKHKALARASLSRFADAPTPSNLNFLFHKSYSIFPADLRKSILTLAVQGKLVSQDPNDEPAELLLTAIAKHQANTSTRRRAPDKSTLPSFDLPNGWAWSRFPELGEFGRGKSKHRPRNDRSLFIDGKYPVVQTGDVARTNGSIQTYTSLYNNVGLAQSRIWPAGTLCITIAANIADSGILSFDACFPDSVVGFIPAAPIPSVRYFEYFMRTTKEHLEKYAPATAQKNINLGILEQIWIPIPPAAEQRRIVAKVDQLMALVDQLEAQLITSHATAKKLLGAVISELTMSD